jgi:O-6-methylguanine DNA methyltransferase
MVTIPPISGCRTTKIYCRPDCPAGRRTKPENKIYFRSREEARTNGYRACKICKPDEGDKMQEILFLTHYQSPLGTYVLGSSKKGVVCVKTEDRSKAYLSRWEREGIGLEDGEDHNLRLISQLDAYFAGKLREFKIPLDLRGTSFQRRVWELLCDIPWGETRSYGEIAKALGRPKGARAVGRAVGTNPVSIVVPCHRVIGSDGTLTGYGGGLDRKVALLELETS